MACVDISNKYLFISQKIWLFQIDSFKFLHYSQTVNALFIKKLTQNLNYKHELKNNHKKWDISILQKYLPNKTSFKAYEKGFYSK